MTPEKWKRARTVFDAALEHPATEVGAWLEAECGDDRELLSEVRNMLEEHARTGALDQPVWPLPATPPATLAAPSPVFAPGQLIAGRYRILRYLSRGGMGEVYEAEHQLLPDHVALKTLLPAIASDGAMIARFKQEIQLARRIAHPNVCRVFDLEVHPPATPVGSVVYFLTMEFLNGETLSAHLQREGAMSPEKTLPLLRQMTEALGAAHRAGVIHRDFKPSNVILVRTGTELRAVTTDFGLARSFRAEGEVTATLTSAVAGTLDYMAPELLAGAPAGVRSDVYALGMVAYKMATGSLPYPGETPLSAAFLRAKKPVPSPRGKVPDLPPEWERTILRALEAEPALRFASVHEFYKGLTGEAPSVTLPIPVITRRRALVAAAGVGAMATGGAGWKLWSGSRNRLTPEAARLYQQGVDNIQAGAYLAATKALEQVVQLAPRFSPAHARLAESWLELDLTEKASREFLVVRREDNSSLPAVDRLRIEAIDLTLTRELVAAVAKFETIRKESGDDSGASDVDLGRACEKAHLLERAIEAYRRAAEGPAHMAAAWLRLGVLYSKRRKLEDSEKAFDEADRRYRQASNLEGLTELTLQRGVDANRRGHFEDAVTLLRKAMEQAHDAGSLQQEIGARLSLANVSYATGDTAAAEALAKEALAAAQANQMESLTIRGLINLGEAHQGRNDLQGAERYFRDSLALANRTGSLRLAAQAQLNFASLYDRLDSPDEQLRAAKAALDYYQPNRWVTETFSALTLIARAEQHRGNYAAALSSFERLMDEANKTQNAAGILTAEESLGDVLLAMDDFPKALEHYRRFLELSRDALKIGYAARDCAKTLARLGHHADAVSELKKADAAATTVSALRPSLTRLRAEMALFNNQLPAALEVTRAGLASPSLSPLTMVDLTRLSGLALFRSGARQPGLLKCDEAYTSARKLNDPDEILETGIALLEALAATRDSARVPVVFHDLEPSLEAHPESRWRALALMVRVDRSYLDRARTAAEHLISLWGRDAFQVYLKRPDLVELAKPFLSMNQAKAY